MHPAPSLIFFTTVSGTGFGLIFWTGFHFVRLFESDSPFAFTQQILVSAVIGFVLSSLALTSSLFHLRRPSRAWRALSQWRSSWLSREGILAILTLAVLFLVLVSSIFLTPPPKIFPVIIMVLAVLTVHSTAMIYAQLKAVPAWATHMTPVMYLGFALASGYLLWIVVEQYAWEMPTSELSFTSRLTYLALHCTSWLVMWLWWQRKDRLHSRSSTIETATQLGTMGDVRPFEPPHMGPNYLTYEMGYRVRRDRGTMLRLLSGGVGFVLPVALFLFNVDLIFQFACQLTGMAMARWLFFADSSHTSMLYYRGTPAK